MNTLFDLRTRKALRDVWGNKARALLVVLSISLGMTAVTAIFRARTILERDIADSYLDVHPASAVVYSSPPARFTDEVVAAVQRVHGVDAAQGQSTAVGRIKAGDHWLTLNLVAFDNFNDLHVNVIRPEVAQWPPADRTILLERSAANSLGSENGMGQMAVVESPAGRQYRIKVAGTVHDLTVLPTNVTGNLVYGYVTRNTMGWLGRERDYDQLSFTVTGNKLDVEHIRQVAQQVQRTIEDALKFRREASPAQVSSPVNRIEIAPPNQPLLRPQMESAEGLLGVLAISALVLSAFLVTNTVTALLARQVRQIGAMKAVGAPNGDILFIYLRVVLIFGVIAALVSQPLGSLGAAGIAGMVGSTLNFDPHPWDVPLWHIAAELAVGLTIPVLAALIPIHHALHITVREAMDDSGRGQASGEGWIEKTLEHLRGLPNATLYALRNTFRNKGRLALTLITLAFGGAIVIAVISVAASLVATIDSVRAYWLEDVFVDFKQPYSFSSVRQAAQRIPGVQQVAGSLLLPAMHVGTDERDTNEALDLFGVQVDNNLIQPTVIEGRWLVPADSGTDALVANTNLARQEMLHVGDEVTLRLQDRKTTWRVVGLVTSEVRGGLGPKPFSPVAAYVGYDQLGRLAGYEGKVTRLAVVTQAHDTTMQQQTANTLGTDLSNAGFKVSSAQSANQQQDELLASLSAMLQLLGALAGLFTGVGGLGLLGAMSMNVLERTREVGVLRAVGIENGDLRSVVVTEGIVVGLLSWVAACILSVPFSVALNNFLGPSLLDSPFTYVFPLWAPLAWLVLVIMIAIVASLLPARSATRISVREALVYE